MKKAILSSLVLIIISTSTIFAQYTNALRVTITGYGYSDETVVRFLDDATPDFDGAYDAWKLFSPNQLVPSIFTKIPSNDNLAINSLPLYNNDTTIEIHTKVGVSGLYTVTIEEIYAFDSDYELSITDVNAEEIYSLNGDIVTFTSVLQPNSTTATFTFNVAKTFTTSIKTIGVKENVVIATKGNGKFGLLFNDNTIKNITVFDITGKTVLQDNINSNNYNLSLENNPLGLYIIAVNNGIETTTKKVFR